MYRKKDHDLKNNNHSKTKVIDVYMIRKKKKPKILNCSWIRYLDIGIETMNLKVDILKRPMNLFFSSQKKWQANEQTIWDYKYKKNTTWNTHIYSLLWFVVCLCTAAHILTTTTIISYRNSKKICIKLSKENFKENLFWWIECDAGWFGYITERERERDKYEWYINFFSFSYYSCVCFNVLL